jgi:hypothetical protein
MFIVTVYIHAYIAKTQIQLLGYIFTSLLFEVVPVAGRDQSYLLVVAYSPLNESK